MRHQKEPEERQPFRHWTLTFSEPDDCGMYLETTMPGWLNAMGEHVDADRGWFLWLGRDHKFIHLRHVYERAEIVSIVEALTGLPWAPTKAGNVRVRRGAPEQVT